MDTYVMGIICTPSWVSHVHHMDIFTCTPHEYHMTHRTYRLITHGVKCHTGVIWGHGYHKECYTTWVSHATTYRYHICTLPHGYHIHNIQVSHMHALVMGITCMTMGLIVHQFETLTVLCKSLFGQSQNLIFSKNSRNVFYLHRENFYYKCTIAYLNLHNALWCHLGGNHGITGGGVMLMPSSMVAGASGVIHAGYAVYR